MRRASQITGDPGSTHRASVEAVFNLSDMHIIGKNGYNEAIAAQRLLHLNDAETAVISTARTAELPWSVKAAKKDAHLGSSEPNAPGEKQRRGSLPKLMKT